MLWITQDPAERAMGREVVMDKMWQNMGPKKGKEEEFWVSAADPEGRKLDMSWKLKLLAGLAKLL